MALFTLERTQVINTDLATAWDFFRDPRNLAQITPPWLNFTILGEVPAAMYPGLILNYRVHPILSIPIHWVTEITHVDPLKYFVDEQRFGPYRMWHHQHHFREVPGGVECRDIVNYVFAIPVLDRLLEPVLVRPKLEEIFDYRAKIVAQRFSSKG